MKKTIKNTKPIKVSLLGSGLLFNSAKDMKTYYDFFYIPEVKNQTNQQTQTIIQFDESFLKYFEKNIDK